MLRGKPLQQGGKTGKSLFHAECFWVKFAQPQREKAKVFVLILTRKRSTKGKCRMKSAGDQNIAISLSIFRDFPEKLRLQTGICHAKQEKFR
jgi:hypothetical protein